MKMVFSSPSKVKTMLVDARVYQDLTSFVNKKLQEQDEPVPFVLTDSLVQTVAETVIDDTWNWASGKSTKVPVISLPEVLKSAGISESNLSQLTAMQKELTQAMSDPQFQQELPPESKEAIMNVKQFSLNGNTISVTPLLVFVATVVKVFKVGIPLFGLASAVSILLILAVSPTNASRAVWLWITTFLSSISFFVAAGLYATPAYVIPILLSQNTEQNYGEGVLKVIIAPIGNILSHQNVAVGVGLLCVSIVFLLARLMVFRNSPGQIVETKIEKKVKAARLP